MRFLCLFFFAGVALAGPVTEGEGPDGRFLAATTLEAQREVLTDALDTIRRLGHSDPVLVWRTGILLGGLVGHEAPGGLLHFERLGDASAKDALDATGLGPHVKKVEWNSETRRTEWEEVIPEYGMVPGAKSPMGRYRVRLAPNFYDLMTTEVEQRIHWVLLGGLIEGTELERHLVRCTWASRRPRLPPLHRFILKMIPLNCATALDDDPFKR